MAFDKLLHLSFLSALYLLNGDNKIGLTFIRLLRVKHAKIVLVSLANSLALTMITERPGSQSRSLSCILITSVANGDTWVGCGCSSHLECRVRQWENKARVCGCRAFVTDRPEV